MSDHEDDVPDELYFKLKSPAEIVFNTLIGYLVKLIYRLGPMREQDIDDHLEKTKDFLRL